MGTNKTKGQTEMMDSREETGVIAGAMVIHPTSHNSKTDRDADKNPTAMDLGLFEG